jgi:hypothetical protein
MTPRPPQASFHLGFQIKELANETHPATFFVTLQYDFVASDDDTLFSRVAAPPELRTKQKIWPQAVADGVAWIDALLPARKHAYLSITGKRVAPGIGG